MRDLKLAINVTPIVKLSDPTSTKASIAAKIATFGIRTPNGWALTSDNLGEGYKKAVGNFLKLRHGERSPILGYCVNAIIDGEDVYQSFDISRAAVREADLQLEDLPRTHAMSIEWFYGRESSYCIRGEERLSVVDALNKGYVSLSENEIKVEDEETTLFPCDIEFSDTAAVDLRFDKPNYRNARIIAATNTMASRNEISFEELGAALQRCITAKLGVSSYIIKTFRDKVLCETYAPSPNGPETPSKLYWIQYDAVRDENGIVSIEVIGEPELQSSDVSQSNVGIEIVDNKKANIKSKPIHHKTKEVKNRMDFPVELKDLNDGQRSALEEFITERDEKAKNDAAAALDAYKTKDGAELLAKARQEARDGESLVHTRLGELSGIHPIADAERDGLLNALREVDDNGYEMLKLRRQNTAYEAKIKSLETVSDENKKEEDVEGKKPTSANKADPSGPGLGKGDSEGKEPDDIVI